MIRPIDLVFLLPLALGVLVAFITGFLIFRDPGQIKHSRRLLHCSLFAVALVATSALLFELTASQPRKIAFDCSFGGPVPPTTLTCITTTSEERAYSWRVTFEGSDIDVSAGNSVRMIVESTGEYVVTLTAADDSVFNRQTKTIRQVYRLQPTPARRELIRVSSFSIGLNEDRAIQQEFRLPQTGKIVDIHLEITISENATVKIVSWDPAVVVISASPEGNFQSFPFGVRRQAAFVQGQIIAIVETATPR